MKPLWALLVASALTACGLAGPPVPPGQEVGPASTEDAGEPDADDFFL